MPKAKATNTDKLANLHAHMALVQRGRDFMRTRQAFVTDPECLPAMIMACIAEGAQTRDDIVRNVPRFVGHSYAEVASALDRFSGPSLEADYWYRDEAKTYHLHVPITPIDPVVVLKLGRNRRQQSKKRPLPPTRLPSEVF